MMDTALLSVLRVLTVELYLVANETIAVDSVLYAIFQLKILLPSVIMLYNKRKRGKGMVLLISPYLLFSLIMFNTKPYILLL
jgi:hypothetical protein